MLTLTIQPWFRFLTSMKLAILLLAFTALVGIVGVMWPDQDWALAHIYQGWWFRGLMGFLCVDILFCVSRRLSLRPYLIANVLAHVSIVVILLGCLVSQFGVPWLGLESVRGYVVLSIGETSRDLKKRGPKNAEGATSLEPMPDKKLPFDLHLKDFTIDYYPPPPPRLTIGVRNPKQPDGFDQKLLPITRDRWETIGHGFQLQITDQLSNASFELVPLSQEIKTPALVLHIRDLADPSAPSQMTPLRDGERPTFITMHRIPIRFNYLKSGETIEQRIEQSRAIVQAMPMLSQLSDEQKKNFRWIVVVQGENLAAQALVLAFEGDPQRIELAKGRYVALGDLPMEIRLDQFLPDPQNVRFDIREARSGEEGTPALQVKLRGPLGDESHWLFLNDNPTRSKDEQVAMVYFQPEARAQSNIQQWNSELEVRDNHQSLGKGFARVNEPFKFRGWNFYQMDWDKEREQYTVLEAVHDPGIPVVYSGLALLFIGVSGMLWLKPKDMKETKYE